MMFNESFQLSSGVLTRKKSTEYQPRIALADLTETTVQDFEVAGNILAVEERVSGSLLLLHSDQTGPNVTADVLDDLNCPSQISEIFMHLEGGWSLFYYHAKLKKVFVGRDIFGRFSLLFSQVGQTLHIACAAHPSVAEWFELPYGQVTVIDLTDPCGSCEMHSYFDKYVDDFDAKWRGVFANVVRSRCPHFDELVTVSRSIPSKEGIDSSSLVLIQKLESAMRRMLPPSLASVAVCFSGGIDSLLIARALDSVLPLNTSIDLINVAFGDTEAKLARASDRGRANEGFEILKKLFPARTYRLLLVNVNSLMLENARRRFISASARPCCTVLDDSISCVLWFALRGVGIDCESGLPARSESDIRFVGSGADEIFAGYARHRTRFERDGSSIGVAEECEAEMLRLGARNGGRDGRVAAQLNVQLKAPFLDGELVRWANALPVEDKACLSLPRGYGEKMIIRKALANLGLPNESPKQAMQFGSGMVKLEGSSGLKASSLSKHHIIQCHDR